MIRRAEKAAGYLGRPAGDSHSHHPYDHHRGWNDPVTPAVQNHGRDLKNLCGSGAGD